MKRMKRMLALCIVAMMSISLVACGNGKSNDSNGDNSASSKNDSTQSQTVNST